jgi:uncharacterized membrane protein
VRRDRASRGPVAEQGRAGGHAGKADSAWPVGRPWAAGSGWTAMAIAVLVLGWLATFALHPWSDETAGDLASRSSVADLVLGGALPYRDFLFEYPPLAAPVIALPGLAGTEESAYRVGIAIMTFAAALGVLFLSRSLARRTGGSARLAMLGVAAAPFLLGAVIRLHVDIVPVALVLAALVAILARRTAAGFALIGLGAMTKAFPLVVAPVALAWLVSRGERTSAVRGAVALGAALSALALIWLALSPAGALDALRFQLERPLQIESTGASVLFGLGSIGGQDPAVVESHRSAGVTHPLAGVVGATLSAMFALVVALLVALATRARDERGLVIASLAAVAAFAALGRVLSPQYLVWVVPLMALALAWREWLLAVLAALACALTLAEFPSRYLDLTAADPLAVAIVAARNVAVVAVVCVAGAVLARRARDGPTEPGPVEARSLALGS